MAVTQTEQFSKGLADVVAGTTSICTINPQDETLLYRGYSAIELAENAVFEEVVQLLIEGKLPKKRELQRTARLLVQERKLPKLLVKILKLIPVTSSPMDVLRTSVSVIGSLEENRSFSIEETKQIAYSLIAKLPFALMTWFHLSKGEPLPKINKKLSFAGRFLQLITGTEPTPFAERVLNASLICYAEHELNASTFAARVTASTLADIYSCVTSGICALKGPLHGGANEGAMQTILKFVDASDAERGIKEMLARKEKIMGFGHRVYKRGDSRAMLMKKYAKELAVQSGKQKYFEIADRIEKVVREQKGLFPNVDFYAALAYFLLGIPIPLYTPIFVLSRTSGWSAHIIEQFTDNRLIRPRAIYTGPPQRPYIQL